ncbi:MAG: tripartite tricarboxylate transporter TctB family protein [Deltaproteobacteria bacterium]|nr:tripartite tricarboxylate transporter TctB family protein [Deltaproteobacteria bacterium]
MKKSYIISDLAWILLALTVCWGGLKLGFGSFKQPHAGFMPFLSGLLLGVRAFIDLVSGSIHHWREEKEDKAIWANIHWGKLLFTLLLLFLYAAFFSTLGFVIATLLILLFLYRVMEPRPWRIVVVASVITTGLFYVGFKIGLDSQLPRGFLGF